MQHPYVYVGCFISRDELNEKIRQLNTKRLAKTILEPHITFAYKPEKVDRSLFGEEMTVSIIGYGNDGTNEGLAVRVETSNPILSCMINQISVPHITLSVSETGKAVDTRELKFVPITPILVHGKFGGFLSSGKVDLVPGK